MSEPRLFEYGDHWLVRRKDTENLYIYWCRPGTRRVRRRSTGTPDFEEAKHRLIAFADARTRTTTAARPSHYESHPVYTPPTHGPALLELMASYVEWLKDNGRVSWDTAAFTLKRWAEFCQNEDVVWVSELTLDVQEKYIRHRRQRLGERISTNGTLKREFGVVNAALRLAWRKGQLQSVPYIVSVPSPPPRERFLTAEEASRLIAACDEPHQHLFILLALHTLQRPKALFGLQVDQVDLAGNRIDFRPATVVHSKKRYPVVPITATLRPVLERAIERSKRGYVIEKNGRPVKAIRKAFARAVAKAGLKGVTPYTLRHTGATLAAAAGVPIRQISGMLGHSTSRVTELVYAKHQPEYLRTMADALDNLFGGEATASDASGTLCAPTRTNARQTAVESTDLQTLPPTRVAGASAPQDGLPERSSSPRKVAA